MTKTKKPTKRDLALDQVVRSLESLGFVPDGETRSETVRVATNDAPVLGHGGSSGGELRTFGGRARFHLPGTDLYVTVGKMSTFIYRLPPNPNRFEGAGQRLTKANRARPSTTGAGLGNYDTAQHEAIQAALVLAKYEKV